MGKALAAHLSLAALAFVWLACEQPARRGAAPPGGAYGERPFARALCDARCARTIRCEGDFARSAARSALEAPGAAACGCGSIEDSGLLRADWAQAEIACLGRTPCDADDECEAVAYRAMGAAPLSWPPVVMRCLQRGDTCGGSSAGCRRLAALSDDARAEAAICFDRSCDASDACLRSFFASRVAPVVPAWR